VKLDLARLRQLSDLRNCFQSHHADFAAGFEQ
jgi:hypothetical protein